MEYFGAKVNRSELFEKFMSDDLPRLCLDGNHSENLQIYFVFFYSVVFWGLVTTSVFCPGPPSLAGIVVCGVTTSAAASHTTVVSQHQASEVS